MLTRGRVVLVVVVLLGAAAVYTGWQLYQTQKSLRDAQAQADQLVQAVQSGTPEQREAALDDLQASAGDAADRTDGPLFSTLGHLPVVGDDARGVRAVSRSLDILASDGLPPLVDSVDKASRVIRGGAIQTSLVRRLHEPVATSAVAFQRAEDELADLDSSGFMGALRGRYDEYVDRLDSASRGLDAAETATRVLPGVVGGEQARSYLLVFQNNAEIRATGGLPGSWAVLNADDGRLSLGEQGAGASILMRESPVLPLTDEEQAVYGEELGTYFVDATFTPDFPRASELLMARWEETHPGTELDGVMAIDPVSLSYLLRATGPVAVGDRSVSADNAVAELLNRPYLELDPTAQDVFFALAAKSIFTSVTQNVADPLDFFSALSQSVTESRMLFFDENADEQQVLDETPIAGRFPGDDGSTAHVDVDVNDTTGSKMSYYLRHDVEVEAASCNQGVQTLRGTMTLSQTVEPAEAAKLPASVTGGGQFGIPAGTQLLTTRIYAPFGGTISDVAIDGQPVEAQPLSINGRPVAVVSPYLGSTAPVRITFTMTTGQGQIGDVEVGVTPGVEPGDPDSVALSAC